MVRLVGHPAGEHLVVAQGDDDIGAPVTDHPGDVAAQAGPIDDHSVVVVEELDDVDADLARTVALLLGPQRPGFLGGDGVDPGLTAGGQQVGDRLARLGPAVDSGGRAVFDVVRMGNDHKDPVEALVEGLKGEAGRHTGRLAHARTIAGRWVNSMAT